ncbi:MAG TPA: glutamine-hydrolyzing GMP synthase, partial [Thermomicrobiales bacterium]|nr:glutamine-hydrolyzing GMP synthase [Thermomicrobiales bacterium]
MTVQPTDSILIVDFGSQVTQLIARRVREAGVYSEIAPFNAAEEAFHRLQPRGVIFSGGPASVTADNSPRAPRVMFDSGVPLLGICYGQQTLHQQLGGKVVSSDNREFGRAFIEVVAPSALFDGLWRVGEKHQVWMSHGDRVETLAPGFSVVAASEGAPFAIATDEAAKRYSLMFHPEVVHPPDGGKLLANFVRHVCGCAGDWTMASFRESKIAEIRQQVGDGRVICGLSGGVDSAVAAVLIHEAIGDQLTCVFVDHGLMRLGEAEQV